ncbi:hypothetical protein [Halosimplex sp. J119]
MGSDSTGTSQLITALLGIAIILFSLHLTVFGVYEGDEARNVLHSGILFGGIGLIVVFITSLRS